MEQVVFLDAVHPVLFERLVAHGMSCRWENQLSRDAILEGSLSNVHGIVLRSRLTLDLPMLQAMPELRWIARSGAGLENIDTAAAADSGIQVINSPEGNAASVGEHVIGQLLMLLHKLASSRSTCSYWRLGSRSPSRFGTRSPDSWNHRLWEHGARIRSAARWFRLPRPRP